MQPWIQSELDAIRAAGLERRLRSLPQPGGRIEIDGRPVLSFASNDYLNLARNPDVARASADAAAGTAAGAGASRLVSGTLGIHERLEAELASLKGYESALVFGSGYLANLGAIQALAGRRDWIVADRLAHASLLDGAALSGARLRRFHHNDAGHLDNLLKSAPASGRRLVVTESVFSMDGDLAPLADLAAVAERHGALLFVDEAHATGVFGPAGAGLVRAAGLESAVHVSMGTLSKALGSYGGFVACSAPLRDLLINRSRSFIFSTALPPPAAAAALAALRLIRENPDWGNRLLSLATRFRDRLREGGLDTGRSESPIIPVMLGDNEIAVRLSARLMEKDLLVPAIRPPAVQPGAARLRLSVTLAHRESDLDRAADGILEAARQERALTG